MIKTKSQLRLETELALKQFLRSGGTIEVSSRKARAPRIAMSGKTTRASIKGTSGFAAGYPRKSGI